MSSRVLSVLLLCVLFLAAAPSFAEWPGLEDVPPVEKTGSNDVAVIVAVEDYFVLPDVTGAIQNANDWEVFLRNGLGVTDVHVLANQDATREAILRFADTAAKDVGEGGTVWWVFIGHGAPDVSGEDGLVVGVDAQQSVESLQARSVPQNELLKRLSTKKARTVMVVDACFSGRSSDGEALAAGVQPVVAVDAKASLGPISVVLSAAKATEVAGQLEGVERPAFSYLVLGALRGWADDGDGEVTANEAVLYARRVLRGVKGRQQTPQIQGYTEATLSRGVTETKPSVVAESSPSECAENEVLENGRCVAVAKSVETPKAASADDTARSEAERTLEYLQERLVWENRVVRQAGRILEGPAFYHAIDRPDLAAEWKSHKPALWMSGIGLTVASVALFVGGIVGTVNSRSIGWAFGGIFAGMMGIAGGSVAITFGFIGNKEPMNYAERRSASEAWNKELREKLDLGPEVDWQNQQPTKKRGFPFGWAPRRSPSLGFTFTF